MTERTWVPDDVPLDKPSPARMWDYYLGGYHNFAVDRAAAEAALAVLPDLRLVTQANRAFLRRAVKFLVGEGIDQFLDLGSGIPTVENVHEVAQQFNSGAEFAAFFDGLEFVEPGLVWVPLWRPDSPDALLLDQPSESRTLGGVGRKP